MNTSQVRSLMRVKYAAPEWAYLEEVANGTGGHCGRHCDAMAMSLWPSRGLHLHGFEIKVSRSDWTRERKNPAKAEAIAKHCHFWWVVAPASIVPVAEVPPNWGLIEASDKGGLKVAKTATMLEPVPLDWHFFAAFARAATEQSVDATLMKAEFERGRSEMDKHHKTWQENASKREQKALDELRRQVQEFESKAGIRITGYGMGNVAEKIRMLSDGDRAVSNLRRELGALKHAAETVTNVLEKLDAETVHGATVTN